MIRGANPDRAAVGIACSLRQRSCAEGALIASRVRRKPSRHNKQAMRRKIEKADLGECVFFMFFLVSSVADFGGDAMGARQTIARFFT
jgi:hypothetical protein